MECKAQHSPADIGPQQIFFDKTASLIKSAALLMYHVHAVTENLIVEPRTKLTCKGHKFLGLLLIENEDCGRAEEFQKNF